MGVDEIVEEYGAYLKQPKVRKLLKRYQYQLPLTKKLDAMVDAPFSIETLLEIVLWKTNRYPDLTSGLLRLINDVREIRDLNGTSLIQAKITLQALLEIKGVQLPMASTILRFRNHHVFQIIDARAYAIVCGDEPLYPSKPAKGATPKYLDKSVEIYFDYLAKLRTLSARLKLDFTTLDRVLYQLHKDLGYTVNE